MILFSSQTYLQESIASLAVASLQGIGDKIRKNEWNRKEALPLFMKAISFLFHQRFATHPYLYFLYVANLN